MEKYSKSGRILRKSRKILLGKMQNPEKHSQFWKILGKSPYGQADHNIYISSFFTPTLRATICNDRSWHRILVQLVIQLWIGIWAQIAQLFHFANGWYNDGNIMHWEGFFWQIVLPAKWIFTIYTLRFSILIGQKQQDNWDLFLFWKKK